MTRPAQAGTARARIVAWDFDGTLVDSRHRNLSVNHAIVRELTGRQPSEFPALTTVRSYEAAIARARDWRDFYAREFGLRDDLVERAGVLWPRLQAADPTPLRPFDGIVETLDALADLPHAIVSQNDSVVIHDTLTTSGLAERFRLVLGHREVGPEGQKPSPAGLLRCLELADGDGPVDLFFVGDHEVDAQCAHNARAALAAAGRDVRIVGIAARYGTSAHAEWGRPPDRSAATPAEVAAIVLGEDDTPAG
ncbi:MAG: HAD hydrolase-like protein [Gemmatimonadota bacterium]|nr:HAD hydrolase-like protein [Gemmatimonadota bacterium]